MSLFGTRAGLAVDLFLLLLVLVLPTMLVAVALVRRGRVRAHRRLMTGCFLCFLAAVVAFEVEVRFGSPGADYAPLPLAIHLCFAIPCLLLWIAQMWTSGRALAAPAPHRRRGRILLVLLSLTVATGFWLYVETFVTDL